MAREVGAGVAGGVASGTGRKKMRVAKANEVAEGIPKLKAARDELGRRMDADVKLRWTIFADFSSALDMSMSDMYFTGGVFSHHYKRHEFPHPEPSE